MADEKPKNDLPDGTEPAIREPLNSGAIATERNVPDDGDRAILTIDSGEPGKGGERAFLAGGAAGLSDKLRTSGEKLADKAGTKARGLVSQGLERTSEALANVSRMVGDTVPGIEERLGAEYGDYARRAAGAIENAASSLSEKDPDELIDDTRNFVRNSPGVALAGAAVVGFVLARLIKSGLPASRDRDA